jgi:hypothetical protein
MDRRMTMRAVAAELLEGQASQRAATAAGPGQPSATGKAAAPGKAAAAASDEAPAPGEG